ncbi:hypothetical protein ACFLU5_08315 [Bacteroidota bacterium]
MIWKQKLTKARVLRNAGNKKVAGFRLGGGTEALRGGKIVFRNQGFFRGFEILTIQRDMRGCLSTTVDRQRNGKRTSGD